LFENCKIFQKNDLFILSRTQSSVHKEERVTAGDEEEDKIMGRIFVLIIGFLDFLRKKKRRENVGRRTENSIFFYFF